MNYHNPADVAKQIAELKNIELQKCSLDDVKSVLSGFLIPHHTFPQIAGEYVFRGQVNDSDSPFDSISRISYNPNPSDYTQRASLPGENVFYASNGIGTVAYEAIQDELRKDIKPFYYLTVGKWQIKSPLEIMLICHSKQALMVETGLEEACSSLERNMRETKGYNDSQILAWQMRCEFVADEFAKGSIQNEHDYYFSALFASNILRSIKKCDGILYPSVAVLYNSQNIAYRTSLIDTGAISLAEVIFLEVQVTKEKKVNYKVIKVSNSFEGDKIIW